MENEKLIRDRLAADLSILDPYLSLIEKEFRLPNNFGSKGYVDLLAKDQYDNYVIIEIKRTRASSRETLQEIFKYIGLIRLNYGAKDSEMRAIILSVDWEELFVPFCEMVEQSGLAVKGYRLHTDGAGTPLKCELVERKALPKVQRDIAPIYHADMFFTREKRDAIITHLTHMSKMIGIQDFAILTMAGDPKYEFVYPFATCFAFNSLSTKRYEEILQTTGELDMERDDFESEQEYRFYMEQCILISLKSGPWHDSLEVLTPESLDSALGNKWTVESIHRAGIFKEDPRLRDEILIEELRGLRGRSRIRYIHFGESNQQSRIDEIERACLNPFTDMREWAFELENCWKFIKFTKRPYRLVIGSACPESVFYGILRFLEQGNEGYLPSYRLFVDFYEDNLLYVLEGGLCWNGAPVSLRRVTDYISDEKDALIGKPIDLVSGFFDTDVLPYLELHWQTGVLIFGEHGLSEGGLAEIDDLGKLKIIPPDSLSMEDWLKHNQPLKNALTSIFSKYIISVTAPERRRG